MNRPQRDWRPQPIDGVPDGLIVFDGVCVFCSSWVQFVIARRRYRWFGRADFCMMPTPELAARFVFDEPLPATR